jgi:hypothetical protein
MEKSVNDWSGFSVPVVHTSIPNQTARISGQKRGFPLSASRYCPQILTCCSYKNKETLPFWAQTKTVKGTGKWNGWTNWLFQQN